jgi:hypothetical protein
MERITKIAHLAMESKAPSLTKVAQVSEGMMYHLENGVEITNNIFRPNSESFFNLFVEARELVDSGILKLSSLDMDLLDSDIGKFAEYGGELVPLDFPLIDEELEKSAAEYKGKKVQLGRPQRGGSKKFYVYVKCGDRVKKISFGDPNLSVKVGDPERRKSFVARHKCHQKNDRCTAGYWSCRIGRFPHLTGAKQKYPWW